VKSGRQKGGQEVSQRVDKQMGHGLCTRAELKHGQNFGKGESGQPQPKYLGGAAQPGAQQWSSCRCGSWRLQKECVCNV